MYKALRKRLLDFRRCLEEGNIREAEKHFNILNSFLKALEEKE